MEDHHREILKKLASITKTRWVAVCGLERDALVDLVAIALVGRGDCSDFQDARVDANALWTPDLAEEWCGKSVLSSYLLTGLVKLLWSGTTI
jgi:hypothetical protein